MWSLTITNPRSEPLQIKLVPGRMLLGRMGTCDIVINDAAASRRHAEIFYDPLPELVTIKDLKSSNGTYVNRQQITGLYRLQNGDVIRVGQTVMHLARITNAAADQVNITGTRQFTRELVLEAVDEHPILLQEFVEALNTVVDVDSAIAQIIGLIKRAMGVDVCQIVLAQDFKRINTEGADNLIVRTIRSASVESTPFAMCLPVMSSGKPLALIYLEKNRPEAHPFEKRDLQLAVAISHQTALTLQRIELLDKIRREGQVKQLLLRFVSPIESEEFLRDYLSTGHLPALSERKVSVLYAEIDDAAGIAGRIGSEEFSAFLSRFFRDAAHAVLARNGVAKFLGDGVLAAFVEAEERLDAEERAVGAAQDILECVRRMDPPEVDRACTASAAVHTAKAVVGYVGAQERAEFNVLGNLIKATSRMYELARANRILVGPSTAQAVHNKYMVQKADNLPMPGGEEPMELYEVSAGKTSPFVQKEENMSAAIKAIAQKLKGRGD